jgi:transcriptional regulator with XRE-family HTH domain
MQKFATKGEAIKTFRMQRASGSLQKEMAFALGLSIRTLRSIENANKPVTLVELENIASYLDVRREEIAFAIDGPKLVFPSPALLDKMMEVTMDQAKLVAEARTSHDVRVHLLTTLTPETDGYVMELAELLTAQTWNAGLRWQTGAPDVESVEQRVRELLVLLRGNDVWTYFDNHFRTLPECDEIPPDDEASRLESRLVIGFGPPGEYG